MTIKEIIGRERWDIPQEHVMGAAALYHNASIDRIEKAVEERIEELEAQVPKTVMPEVKPHLSRYGALWVCDCAKILDGTWRYNFCPHCGAKLNWEEE